MLRFAAGRTRNASAAAVAGFAAITTAYHCAAPANAGRTDVRRMADVSNAWWQLRRRRPVSEAWRTAFAPSDRHGPKSDFVGRI
jgi:hypothetical protein